MTDCVLPGCHNHVPEPGDTCLACIQIFGPMLRPTATRLNADDITARDTQVRAAYHHQKGDL